MHKKRKAQIEAAEEISKLDRSVCAKCGMDLGRDGLVVETEEFLYSSCEPCYADRPPNGPHLQRLRGIQFEELLRLASKEIENGIVSHDERAVRRALRLGLEVRDRRGLIIAAFDRSSPGWSGDGDNAPSWYGRNARRWTSYAVRRNGEITISEIRKPFRISVRKGEGGE